ncbi:hypothetical protein ACHAPJ_012782 [Fusarium lateritium]
MADVHKLSVLGRRTGCLNYQEDQQALEWYTDLFGETPLRSPFWQDEASEGSNGNNTITDGELTHKAIDKHVYQISDDPTIQAFRGLDQGQSSPRGEVSPPDQACDRTGDQDEDSANNENNEQVDHVEAKSYAGIDKGKESKIIADLHAELEKFI